MSDETIPPVEDDQPEPEEELKPALEDDDEVTDEEMGEPRGLPKTSFVADDQDVFGKEDHPNVGQAPYGSPEDPPQETPESET
jgi:hypothetical protein